MNDKESNDESSIQNNTLIWYLLILIASLASLACLCFICYFYYTKRHGQRILNHELKEWRQAKIQSRANIANELKQRSETQLMGEIVEFA